MTCDVFGCDETAVWQIKRANSIKIVCRSCRDNLIAMGWRLLKSTWRNQL